MNCDAATAQHIAQIFSCVVGKLPFTYLGLPMGTTKPSVQDLMPLVCGVQQRLSATLSMISYGGKLSLLNSVITSLIIFALCTLKLPQKIIDLLDKIRRQCLWTKKTDDGDKCNSLASWQMVCRPKECGGLGVLDLQTQSDALLMKYLHKFYNHWDLPWVDLIWSTYYNDKIPHASDPCGSFWWKDVLKLTPIYRGISQVIVRKGDTVLMWKDLWLDDVLANSRPRAFSYAKLEDISVRDFLGCTSLNETFNLPLFVQAHNELLHLKEDVLANHEETVGLREEVDLFSVAQGCAGIKFQTRCYDKGDYRGSVSSGSARQSAICNQ